MTSLEYQILIRLSSEDTLGTELYEMFDFTEAHIRTTLNKMQGLYWVTIQDRVKQYPGEAGRPVNLYGILPEGQEELDKYNRQLEKLK